jgi:UTP--glucose-1-phosphate uridylyltransferase
VEVAENVIKAKDFIEKPSLEEAPSNLVVASRYIFTPEIFEHLDATKPGKNNEIQITDAMRALIKEQDMYGVKIDGKRFDIGNKLDFIKTNVLFGMEQDDIGEGLREWIKELAGKL